MITLKRHLVEHTNDQLKNAMWWVQRWISGSMNDPDWSNDGSSMNIDQAFDIIQEVVGNREALKYPVLWRMLAVTKQQAVKLQTTKLLASSPRSKYQSFTISKRNAIDVADWVIVDSTGQHGVQLMVTAKVPPQQVMFSMMDLLKHKNPVVQEYIQSLDHWYHQNEVVVRVEKPLRIIDAEMIV